MSVKKNTILDITIYIGFGLSGAAALIYEIVWTRNLSTVMGSSTYALSTMLAAFMGGLSLGGYLGGKLTLRFKNMGLIFSIIEFGIGITGMITLALINALTPLYLKSYFTFHLSFHGLSFMQFLINFIIMGIPTTLMGMTFPVVIKYFSPKKEDIGEPTGNLYSINTFGAIIGSASAGFILIPFLGVYGAAFTAIILNMITAFIIFQILFFMFLGCLDQNYF